METNGKKTILVFTHGGATDMLRVRKEIEKGRLNAEIVALVCDNPDAVALKRAKKFGTPTVLIELKDKTEKARKEFNKEIMKVVKKYNPDAILLLGWMKILSRGFVKKYSPITFNLKNSSQLAAG
jgi:phosphoribosylglycinamide formyltransferase 1